MTSEDLASYNAEYKQLLDRFMARLGQCGGHVLSMVNMTERESWAWAKDWAARRGLGPAGAIFAQAQMMNTVWLNVAESLAKAFGIAGLGIEVATGHPEQMLRVRPDRGVGTAGHPPAGGPN